MALNMFVNMDKLEQNTKAASKYLKRHLVDVVGRRNVRQQINTVLRDHADKYVPYEYGPLSQNVRVSWKGINYLQKYAKYQYYIEWYHHPENGPHPLAHHNWIRYAYHKEAKSINAEWREIIVQNARKK